ncbi:MAG: GrrA/OscA1 family cyclophane-containing rSAM-modified RiPP [Merismopediaceae bacterium]|nr:GrrA/OscA1 family cyclophane-containing rSAM-modified RiPP [Merismopediaceae bacterium]
MNFSTRMSWAAFLVTLAALPLTSPEPAEAKDSTAPVNTVSVGDRLARISSTLQNRAEQLPKGAEIPTDALALGWGNGRGGGTFVNSGRGGWGNRSGGGGFGNLNPWRNGWGDGGGFINRSWPNSGWGNGGRWWN